MSVLPPGSNSIKQTSSNTDPVIAEQFDKHVQHVRDNNLSHILLYKDTDGCYVIHGATDAEAQAHMIISALDGHAQVMNMLTGSDTKTQCLQRMAVLTKLAVQILEHATDDEIIEAMNMWLRGMALLKKKREK